MPPLSPACARSRECDAGMSRISGCSRMCARRSSVMDAKLDDMKSDPLLYAMELGFLLYAPRQGGGIVRDRSRGRDEALRRGGRGRRRKLSRREREIRRIARP